MKRGGALLLTLYSAVVWAAQRSSTPRAYMPLQDRLKPPQGVSSVSLRLTDFVGFIATSYKVLVR